MFFASCLGLKIHILVHLRPILVFLLYCTEIYVQVQTSSTVRLPSLTFQADCGSISSIKCAGEPTEEGTEHYLPWW